MTKIHEILYKTGNLDELSITEYFANLIDNLIRTFKVDLNRIKISLAADRINLDVKNAIHFGLINNELVSNSLKHAFPEGKKGKINIRFLKEKGDFLTLEIIDNGTGFPKTVNYLNPDSLGMQIVMTSTKQLNGVISLQSNKGIHWKMQFKN